jgi:ribonuclease D
MHRARGRRALAAVRELWETRNAIAERRDVTPGRIIPDSSIVEAANAMPRDKASLVALRGFRGRGATRYAHQWIEALRTARTLAEEDLPPVAARYDGPPPPRAWAERDPVAAARLVAARTGLKQLADEHRLPVENLLTPDYVRRLMWEPPDGSEAELRDAVTARLQAMGARPWQVELSRDLLVDAIASPPTAAVVPLLDADDRQDETGPDGDADAR